MAMGPGKAEGLAASRPGPGLPEGGRALAQPPRVEGERGGGGCEVPDRVCQGKPRVRSPEGGLSWKERERARLQRPRFLSRVVQCVPVCRFGVSRRFATRRSHGRRDPSPPPLHLLIFCRTLDTQEPMNCTNHTAYVQCLPAPNITCKDHLGIEKVFTGHEVGFYKPIPCRNVNGYSYKVAVALSLFLGWLGADRFYLGYPALGLLKFCTVGFCGIGSLIDFILISMQIVGPSDGSSYIIDYYGARLTRLTITNATFRKMQTYP
uniref:TM2 domain containing 1 n=1 Tax=Accipiter nisus TaxID=211598 RepID=A0A8B9MJ64_9AVES